MTDKSSLVINAGSSSLKFALFDANCHDQLHGSMERLQSENARLRYSTQQKRYEQAFPHADLAQAIEALLNLLAERGIRLDVIVHRVVHGGEAFHQATLITEEVCLAIEGYCALAPLHNPLNLQGIRLLQQAFPNLPQVVVFDTAFHQTLSPSAYLYGVPYEWYEDYCVRRYGFHGTSHRYVCQQTVQFLDLDAHDHGVISLHLGNGCSACAVQNGNSIQTSMGLTPLDGLLMGTRSGSIDPGLLHYVATQSGQSLAELTTQLNKRSGLFGLSGLSADMRELLAAEAEGHAGAAQAIDIFCMRVAQTVAAYCLSLRRWDALIFTGGIGEHAAVIRQRIVEKLGNLGLKMQENNHTDLPCVLHTADSQTAIVVMPTDEERAMLEEARQTLPHLH